MVYAGLLGFLINTPTGRLLRRSSAEKDRPAYFAAQFSLSHACWLITYPLVGWLGASIGIPATFYVMAGIVALGFVLALLLWPAEDQAALTHIHKTCRLTIRILKTLMRLRTGLSINTIT